MQASSSTPSPWLARLAALATAILLWQVVVWSGWKPVWLLPSPLTVFLRLATLATEPAFYWAIFYTLVRAVSGYAMAVGIGVASALLMLRFRLLRTTVAGLLTGLQSMPSVIWFPLAILLFQLGEGAILFVVVLGAFPSIANGLLHSIDHIPPLWIRAGKMLGARGWSLVAHVYLPAAMPGFVGGLKQGWAFAWRSLMAGELLVIISDRPSIGTRLSFARELSDAPDLLAWMIVVLGIGMLVDGLLFSTIERRIRIKRGLFET